VNPAGGHGERGPSFSRRELLQCLPPLVIAVPNALFTIPRALAGQDSAPASRAASTDPALLREGALGAARWLAGVAIKTTNGCTWPTDPAKPEVRSTDLYSGSAGAVLFLATMGRQAADHESSRLAAAGADEIVAQLPERATGEAAGLYTGVAGIGWVLREISILLDAPRFARAAERCTRLVRDAAQPAGAGVEWSGVNDVVSGAAGIGLYLLDVARRGSDSGARETAIAAGKRLLELGRPARGGLSWPLSPTFERNMPNFSHGTAGVAYFLAELYRATRDQAFLDAALAGAAYLKSIAKTDDGVCLVFHFEPGGENRYYLGWCHGPAGTARLFWRLHQITRDQAWLDRTHAAARGVLVSGVPQRQTEGWWNNVGQCCGLAGMADFFLSLHRAAPRDEYLAFARTLSAEVLRRATHYGGFWFWPQAEHRVKPEEIASQTGYMQGAAGIGMHLLRATQPERNSIPELPDSPFGTD
jgi:lantibiotic modifying enzyme